MNIHMPWHRFYTSSIEKVTFVLGEIFLEKPLRILSGLTGRPDSYACYLDRKNKVYSEHAVTDENQAKAEVGYRFFTNPAKVKHYHTETLKIISRVEELQKEIDSLEVSNLKPRQILEITKKAEALYADSMGYYLFTQPEYIAKVNEALWEETAKTVPRDQLQATFLALVESEKSTCLETERKDWLDQILIPYKTKKIDEAEKNKRIETHLEKYKFLPATVTSGPWNKAHCDTQLCDESMKPLNELEKELENIQLKPKRIEKKRQELVSRYKLGSELIQKIELVRLLSWLRVEAHFRGWGFLNYLGQVLAEQAGKTLNLDSDDVFNLTMTEFYELLEGKLTLTDEHKNRRFGNILTVITPQNGFEVFWGKDAQNKYESEIAEHAQNLTEFFGQTANGTGRVTGKAFVFRWGTGDFAKKMQLFPADAILVAGQTIPQFMPILRKSKAIITNEGGLLCHAAIVSRELQKPAIIGTKIATEALNDGDEIEMNLETGKITILNKKKK